MTTQSVITAAVNLVTRSLPGAFRTVQDLDDREYEPLRPDDLPALLFTAAPATQAALAYNAAEETWDLEGHIWRFDNPIPGTAPTFRALVEQVRDLFKANPQLAGAANTAHSQLGTLGKGSVGVQTQYSDPIRRGATAERHALVRFRVRDWLT